MLTFQRAQRGRGRAHVAGCCPKTTSFLAQIGCEHAAMMHARRAAKAADTWSSEDWLLHMWEEDTRFFPLCEADPRVTLLRAHHGIFRMEIALSGRILSAGLLAIHSQMEDDIIDEILAQRAT